MPGLLLLVSLAIGWQLRSIRAIRSGLAAGARLTLLEMSVGDGSYLHNPVIEIHVAEDAVLTHVRLQNEVDGGVPSVDDVCRRSPSAAPTTASR